MNMVFLEFLHHFSAEPEKHTLTQSWQQTSIPEPALAESDGYLGVGHGVLLLVPNRSLTFS